MRLLAGAGGSGPEKRCSVVHYTPQPQPHDSGLWSSSPTRRDHLRSSEPGLDGARTGSLSQRTGRLVVPFLLPLAVISRSMSRAQGLSLQTWIPWGSRPRPASRSRFVSRGRNAQEGHAGALGPRACLSSSRSSATLEGPWQSCLPVLATDAWFMFSLGRFLVTS